MNEKQQQTYYHLFLKPEKRKRHLIPFSMKKIFITLLIVCAGLVFESKAQNLVVNPGMEEWTDDSTPVGWTKAENISKESTTIHGGSFSAKHISADGTKDLQQDINGLQGNTTYTISYYYFDNDPAARTRIWSYWLNGTETLGNDTAVLRPNTYSEDADQWLNYNAVLTSPAEATGFRFEVRVYKQDGAVGGAVFYDDFTVTGDADIKPEPTNYPTAFTATAEGMGARLNWTDATGGQLPDAYVVLGTIVTSPKGIPPVDGVPEANNLDISVNGYIAWNVPYGEETFTFSSLMAGEEYMFTIYPYTNSGATIDYKTDGTAPMVFTIINDVTTLVYEPFDADLGVMNAFSITGTQVWDHYNFNDEDFARCSGYEGASNENEDWLVSPQVDFAMMESALLSFRSAYNYVGNPLQLLVSTDYDGVSDPTGFTWTDITSEAEWSAGGWAWAQSGAVSIFEYGNPKLYIAFVYTSTTEASSTWELDDLLIYGIQGVGINESTVNNITVYPNPTSSEIHFNLTEESQVIITDLMGRKISENELKSGKNSMGVGNLTNGTYLLVVKSMDGSTSVSRFNKQ